MTQTPLIFECFEETLKKSNYLKLILNCPRYVFRHLEDSILLENIENFKEEEA